jgi:hypothetical protein
MSHLGGSVDKEVCFQFLFEQQVFVQRFSFSAILCCLGETEGNGTFGSNKNLFAFVLGHSRDFYYGLQEQEEVICKSFTYLHSWSSKCAD